MCPYPSEFLVYHLIRQDLKCCRHEFIQEVFALLLSLPTREVIVMSLDIRMKDLVGSLDLLDEFKCMSMLEFHVFRKKIANICCIRLDGLEFDCLPLIDLLSIVDHKEIIDLLINK